MPKSTKLARETFPGLCGTCADAPVCTLPRNRGVPVMECLEFVGEIREDERDPPAQTEGEDPGPLDHEPGLCSWCETRAVCTFSRPPGGVWSCDEFR